MTCKDRTGLPFPNLLRAANAAVVCSGCAEREGGSERHHQPDCHPSHPQEDAIIEGDPAGASWPGPPLLTSV